jgi:hypothetical protein
MEEDLDRLSKLQELLHDADRQWTYFEGGGVDTTLHDEVIDKIQEEIHALSKKIRWQKSFTSVAA